MNSILIQLHDCAEMMIGQSSEGYHYIGGNFGSIRHRMCADVYTLSGRIGLGAATEGSPFLCAGKVLIDYQARVFHGPASLPNVGIVPDRFLDAIKVRLDSAISTRVHYWDTNSVHGSQPKGISIVEIRAGLRAQFKRAARVIQPGGNFVSLMRILCVDNGSFVLSHPFAAKRHGCRQVKTMVGPCAAI